MTFDGWVDHLMREMLDAFTDDWFRVREPRQCTRGLLRRDRIGAGAVQACNEAARRENRPSLSG
jgi:hypothetical protein